MNNNEAQFLLSSYRPNGRDATDPRFAAALAQAVADPTLRAWFEREQAFDRAVAAGLNAISTPAGLRESILAGAQASSAPARRAMPWWLIAAACVVLLLALALNLESPRFDEDVPQGLTAFAIEDLARHHVAHQGPLPAFAALETALANPAKPVPGQVQLQWNELHAKHCRLVQVGGRDVFEICFKREGAWFHLYVARRGDFPDVDGDPKEAVVARGHFAATAWSDPQNVYSLVTSAGTEALKRVL